MKTTLTLNDTIFRQAKAAAALRGQALGQFVEESVRRALHEQARCGSSAAAWIEALPKVPSGAARDLQDAVGADDFRAVDRKMWE
jgi:hypothetical protein